MQCTRVYDSTFEIMLTPYSLLEQKFDGGRSIPLHVYHGCSEELSQQLPKGGTVILFLST